MSVAFDRAKDAVAKMPPASHRPSREFDLKNSRVIRWIISRPEVQQWLYDLFRRENEIVFDREARKWRGADYVPPKRAYPKRR